MGISLVGIIGMQYFWMQNAIQEKKEQFNQLVHSALANSAKRIEREQQAYFLSHLLENRQNMLQNDSSINAFNQYWNQSNQMQGSLKDQKINADGSETIVYGYDTTIVQGNSTQHIQQYSQITRGGKSISNTDGSNLELANEFEYLHQNLSQVMEQMLMEFAWQQMPIEQQINIKSIRPAVKLELKHNDIDLPFEFAISDMWGNTNADLCSKNFEPKSGTRMFRVQLFPGNLGQTPYQLHIYFPDKSRFLYQSLRWLFIGLILFTLTILATFYYTLKTIFSQKKNSEIKNDFINNMTHEFKTPIATISLAADAIGNPGVMKDETQLKRFTSIIKEENKRMNRQVEGVLQMALLDKNDFNMHVTELHAHEIIQRVIQNMSLQVEQKKGKISFSPAAENDLILADETHFTNILHNLLDNANKYIGDKIPDIHIKTRTNSEYLYLSVSDNGMGMDKATLDRIFEKFYRYTVGDIHTVKGFGLGLSYVKAIVMALKGDISVTSTKGKGSTFTIKLPLK